MIRFIIAGHHMVPKSQSEDEARHGRAKKGCRNRSGDDRSKSQNFFRKC